MPRPFRETMSKIRQGELDEDLTEALHRVVQAVRDTGKVGSVTMKLTIIPTKGLALEIEDKVTVVLPELPKPTTMLFPTVEGNLQVHNPMQKQMDLVNVTTDGSAKSTTVVVDPTANNGGALQQVPGTSANAG